ncbi:hypothetical protein [Streptomyces brasiliensis]|uniref:Secreted protein n=1 Tax=Streptomyces brasiliensis TaxID=1954 RepID=A0A917KLV4_9ACTN|nr:hypothetical protein [Streptomyces brasiliensis]GGJ16815.1 hypothetical protein GCM10010121_029370 [Streptomyces brasiliensis]
MRGLFAGRIASTALCAALLAGITGPVAMAADSARQRSHAVSQAPVPGADALLAQIKSLGNLGGVVTPVTGVLNTVLKADNGQLSTTEATQLINAVKQAIADATPKDIADPRAKDTVSDAVAALQKSLDTLRDAVISGDAGRVATAVTGVVTALVNHVAAVLLAGGLPAPDLPGLPVPTT